MDGIIYLYIFLCYLVAVVGGFIPFFLKFMPNKKLAGTILDVCSAAAGGLFLSGGLIHMLAEGHELIVESGYDFHGLPLSFFLCGITFLFVFFFDKVVATHEVHASFSDHVDRMEKEEQENLKKSLLENDEENPKEINNETQINTIENKIEDVSEHAAILNEPKHHEIVVEEDELGLKQRGWCSIVTLVFAISLHAFFEGLGLGAAADPLPIFIAVCAHKWADSGFTVIFLMTKIKSSWGIAIIAIVFSTFTPVGAFIGMFIMKVAGDSDVSQLIQGILVTLASGTFLYVAVIEILAEQFENGKHKYLKFFLGLILFLAMSLVTLFEG